YQSGCGRNTRSARSTRIRPGWCWKRTSDWGASPATCWTSATEAVAADQLLTTAGAAGRYRDSRPRRAAGSGAGSGDHHAEDTTMSTLVGASIKFHTNNEDKDDDTHVTVTVEDFHHVVAARIDNDFGHFDDHSDSGSFDLEVTNASTMHDLHRGRVT